MIRIKKRNHYFYIPAGVCIDMDKVDKMTESELTQMSVMVVDLCLNSIIKCRYNYSDLMNSHMEKIVNESFKKTAKE